MKTWRKRWQTGSQTFTAFGPSLATGGNALLVELGERLRDEFPGHVLDQVKEKFGVLVSYGSAGPNVTDDEKVRFRQLLHEFEELSATMCELCGNPGQLGAYMHWSSSLCPEHWAARKKEQRETGE